MSATEYPSFIVRSSTGPTLPWRARSSRRLETVALALAICLPVPMFAVLGLSLPLPNFVERIAAALVPWADPVTLEPRGVSGSIVPAAADVPPSPVLGVFAATPSVTQRSGPASSTAKPLAATPATRPAATGDGATAAPAPTALPTAGDEPTRDPVAMPQPAETPTRLAPGATETVRPPDPVPVVPTPPLPEPIPSVPTLPLPVPLPPPVQEAVDDVVAVATEPVGTVGGVVGGIVGGIVPAPAGTTPLPLSGLGR